jgi:uncharacterized delta-60 repeat protein
MRKGSLGRALIGALLTTICTALMAAQPTASLAAKAAPGTVDPSFAGFTDDGIVFESGLQTVSGIALQGDGKTVIVGSTGTANQLGVFRYLPNGRPDPSFDGDGKATFSNMFEASDVAIQSDGRIVVGGTLNNDFQLARLTPGGALDTSFDFDGWAMDTDQQLETLKAVLVQADGKIIACGTARVDNQIDFGVARYTTNGWRDTSFSDDGKVTIGFGAADYCEDMVQQNDGKLVVAGMKYAPFAQLDSSDFAVARLEINGTLDNDNGDGGFDGDGKLTTGFGGDEGAKGVALQPDGKIVVLGNRTSPDTSYIARYMPNGALDSTFDGDGKLSVPVDSLSALALQPDGKILALGYHQSPDGDFKFALHRRLANGAPDATFDGDGISWLDFGAKDTGKALALQPDGRILVAGVKNSTGVLARLWQDGTTFDTGGQQTQTLAFPPVYPPGSYAYTSALAVQSDGKLLVAGELRNRASAASEAVITRFFADGQLDPSFGMQGTVRFWLGNFNAAHAIAIQPDGKIVIAGESTWTGGWVEFLVARFFPDGAPDNTFGERYGLNYRIANFSTGASVDRGLALALAPDGKIVVAGSAWDGARYIWGVARWNSNGTPDNSFDGDGKLFLDFGSGSTATAVVVQPDGRIVVGGQTAGNDFAVARLLDNGAPDASFGEYKNGSTITDMGGADAITALALASSGWIYAVGYSSQPVRNDFAMTQYQPNGILAQCPSGQTCSNWPDGKRLINIGDSDVPYAVALRGDNQILAAGCSDGHMSATQLSTTDVTQPILRFQARFAGRFDCAYAVQFVGSNKDKIVLAGQHTYDSDSNIALARLQTTAYKNGSTALAAADEQTTQETAVPAPSATPTLAPADEQTTQETPVPALSPTPAVATVGDQVDLPDTQR